MLDRTGMLKRYVIICLVILAALLVPLLNPRGAIVSMLSDDAFYYSRIARNIVDGAGCTFDGFARTNGFHPLWMVYSIVVQAVAPRNLEAPVLIIIATNVVMCLATLALLYGMVERHIAPRFGVVAVGAALLPNLLTAMLNGLETGLQLFAMVLVLWLCYRRKLLDPAETGREPLILGLVLGVTTLSRLDSAFIFVAVVLMTIGATVAHRLSAGKSFRRLVMLCAGFGIVMLPYFVWNLLSFGHLTPISGTIKSAFPALRHRLVLVSDMRIGAVMIVVLVVLMAIVIAIGDYRKDRWKKAFSSPLSMLTLASLGHFANAFFFMSWGVYWWHFTIYGLAIIIALAEAAHFLTAHRERFRIFVRFGLVAPMVIAAIPMKGHELAVKGEQHEGWLRAAEWARENTPRDARFALLDAGLFGYFSERSVMSLDGKANSYEYLEYLERGGDIGSYLAERGIEYVANIRIYYVMETHRILIRMPNQPALPLFVKRDWEVYRSESIPSYAPRFGAVQRSHFVIWKIPAGAISHQS